MAKKRKTIGFESLPQALIPAFKQCPPYFNLNGFKTLARKVLGKELHIHTVKYWIRTFFEKYGLVEKNTVKRFYHKKINSISEWLEKISSELDDKETNIKYSKLFYPLVLINRYNTLPLEFLKTELVNEEEKLTKIKVMYWLEKMINHDMIKAKNESKRLTKKNPLIKRHGIKFGDWLKNYLATKIETIETTLEI